MLDWQLKVQISEAQSYLPQFIRLLIRGCLSVMSPYDTLVLIKVSNVFTWCCYDLIRPGAPLMSAQTDHTICRYMESERLIRHDNVWGYPVKNRLMMVGVGAARWKDAGNYNWLIKVRSGQDAGDSRQCASDVVQHFVCEGNTSQRLQMCFHQVGPLMADHLLTGYSFH